MCVRSPPTSCGGGGKKKYHFVCVQVQTPARQSIPKRTQEIKKIKISKSKTLILESRVESRVEN